eukprot:333216-Alexandrium_andersonii.AAC.1
MSASLVGSEMCIRDRLLGGPQCFLRASRGPSNIGRALRRYLRSLPMGACLLYTSDAADDM